MSVLHVFDMDGTLPRGTTASIEIARATGTLAQLEELEELEKAFALGTVDTRGFAAQLHGLWHGLTSDTVAEVFRDSPWIEGVAEVFTDIADRNEHSAVVTMSPDFFADLLRAVGADDVHASRFPALPMHRPPDPAGILTPADKVTIVDGLLARHGIGPDRCIAYGDSGSDIPLFEHLRHTVAVNPTPALGSIAARRFTGGDLYAIYTAARELLSPGT
jgi:phosphoserine phosphatase